MQRFGNTLPVGLEHWSNNTVGGSNDDYTNRREPAQGGAGGAGHSACADYGGMQFGEYGVAAGR
ncbi:hypothetical protein D3C86_2069670 [compost metagenome]